MCYIYAKSYHDCPDVKNVISINKVLQEFRGEKDHLRLGKSTNFALKKRMLGRLQGGKGNAVRKKRKKSQACIKISKWLSVDGA